MAGRPPRQKAKNDARQQLCSSGSQTMVNYIQTSRSGYLPNTQLRTPFENGITGYDRCFCFQNIIKHFSDTLIQKKCFR